MPFILYIQTIWHCKWIKPYKYRTLHTRRHSEIDWCLLEASKRAANDGHGSIEWPTDERYNCVIKTRRTHILYGCVCVLSWCGCARSSDHEKEYKPKIEKERDREMNTISENSCHIQNEHPIASPNTFFNVACASLSRTHTVYSKDISLQSG